MRIHRFLDPDCIRLEMKTDQIEPPEDLPGSRSTWFYKEAVLEELVEVLDASGEIVSRSKLYRDLLHGERRATTGIGGGIAIPHLRTLRTRKFVMGFCRSRVGIPFAAVDGEPVHYFFPMVAPPYDDRSYRRAIREMAEILQEDRCMEFLRTAETPDEVIWGLQSFARI